MLTESFKNHPSERAIKNGQYLDSLEKMSPEELIKKLLFEHDLVKLLRSNPDTSQLEVDIQKQHEIWVLREIFRRSHT